MTAQGQPVCEKCNAPLPWDDVDRGAGACRQCGTPFEFKANWAEAYRLAAAELAAPVAPGSPGDASWAAAARPLLGLSPRVAMFPVTTPPVGVTVTRSAGRRPAGNGYRDNALAVPDRIQVVYRAATFMQLFGLACIAATAALVGFFAFAGNGAGSGLACVAVAGVVGFFIWKQRNTGFVLTCDGQLIDVAQQTERNGARKARAGAADVTTFLCEREEILVLRQEGKQSRMVPMTIYSVDAVLGDGLPIRLITDIDRAEVAFFVAQLLGRELNLPV